MTTIATFSKPEEAHLFRMRLGAVEIEAFVQDENLVQNYWLLCNAVGGVKVQVAAEDVDDAREFLAADLPLNMPAAVEVICPFCLSANTRPEEFSRRVAFMCLLVFGFPFSYRFSRYRQVCDECRRLFRPR